MCHFRHIFQLEALGQVEVKLHGGKLPQASNGVHQLDVDFGAVKCRFARNGLVRNVQLLSTFSSELMASSQFSSPPTKFFLSLGSQMLSSTWYS